jgi:hypothetical protein
LGLRDRLGRLEAAQRAGEPRETPPHLALYLKHAENARREMDGLQPIPLIPEEEELERESERDALENLIPTMRADPGWQCEEAQAMLDEWERSARECVREAR